MSTKRQGSQIALVGAADCVLTLEVCADMAPSPHSPVCSRRVSVMMNRAMHFVWWHVLIKGSFLGTQQLACPTCSDGSGWVYAVWTGDLGLSDVAEHACTDHDAV